jgi:hypothetical protein
MQAPITAAEPLDEPPGVRPESNGLVVGPGALRYSLYARA